ncbi:MAG: hypothetical protein M0D57_08545 [Sphingobacteriales bacterium JAD_PAG50586_3]|nr:MAG: hypothetical protein M0D57_08545 [Sphingobacteriales bacterium JAD_PAG50586_3]
MKAHVDGGVLITDNFLRFKYTGKNGNGKLAFKIIDDGGKIVGTDNDVALTVKNGDNRYEIDLCGKDGITLKKGIYTLVVTDPNNKELFLVFNNNPKYTCD